MSWPSEEFTPEQIDVALVVLATQGGMVNRTLAVLREQANGYETLSHGRLSTWKKETHEQRYFELQEEYATAIARRAAARSMEIAELATQGVEDFVSAAMEGLKGLTPTTAGDVRDLATSARNLSQVQVNSVEKSRLLRDQPTEVHSLESLDELVAVLQAAGVVRAPAIDGEATEETPALEAPA